MPPVPTNVYLFGDSVIDNSVWLADPSQSVAQRLTQRLAPHNATVTDLSVDALKLEDMLQRPNHMTRDYFAMHRYVCDLPAYAIADRYEDIPKHDLSVVSIGGNDVLAAVKTWRLHDHLGYLAGAGHNITRIRRRDLFCSRMSHSLNHVMQRLLERSPHVVLVIPYMPFYCSWVYKHLLGWDISRPCWKKFVWRLREIYYQTQTDFGPDRVSIIDLMEKVDFMDIRNYSSTPIEPSVACSEILCADVERVLLHRATAGSRLLGAMGAVNKRRFQRRCAKRRKKDLLRQLRVISTRPTHGCMWDFVLGQRLVTNTYIVAVHFATMICKLTCRRDAIIGTKINSISDQDASGVRPTSRRLLAERRQL